MEFTLKDEVVKAAVEAPMVFVAASLGEDQQYNREPGIQLTKEQIISLRKYEILGLSLPTRINDVVAYLNYGAGDEGSPGLTALDFVGTFGTTYDHARRWSPLREKIQLTGTDLEGFANTIIGYGDEIIAVYDDLRASQYLDKYNINSVEAFLNLKEILPQLPDLTVPPRDIQDIKEFLDVIMTGVKLSHAKAEEVRRELDSFGTDLREKVLPEIKLRLKSVSENTYGRDIQVLQEEIDQRATEIDELNKQYGDMVKEAIGAAATLNVGGLILGIYQGVQAEKLRKKRNELKGLQDSAIQQLGSKNQTLSSLNRVRGDLQNLTTVTIEAEVATQNLMLVWNALSQFISDSLFSLDRVENAVSLRRFIAHLKAVITPWRQNIGESSKVLVKIFEEAQREIDAGTLINARMAYMYTLSGGSDYPYLNVTALRDYNSNIQTCRTQVQLLAQRYDYMPDVVSRMTSVATITNSNTFGLRNTAQTTINDLNRTMTALKSYQEEWEDIVDEVEKNEWRLEMEVDLQRVFRSIDQQASDLEQIKINLSAHYDMDMSKQRSLALEQDRTFAQGQEDRAKAKRAELLAQMESLSEAINLIGKSGVEKIGQEAQLTVDNLMAMGMAPPQVQVALLALDTVKKLIAGIGETFSYLNMVAGYERLSARASQLRTEAMGWALEVSVIQGKMELIENLDNLDSFRWNYLKEFAQVVDAYRMFVGAFVPDKSQPVEVRASNVVAVIPAIIQYLHPLRG
ncbi:hypothetical protein UG46_22145 [Pseudomonas fluorescens]|uniref:alpha-xenorhabdolysin family binary toxin subunit A n=1 Tax=Pseudomonas fluorescens TaxID=294 RepID=UPI0005DE2566|nr:alpha-xenorhabdolysin family binary toxin subunit A [Pseudomonas fluorescens]KJH84044.1 hypothetical protein UG46_22145 [Pseudomonas fluorescens]